MWQSQAFAKVFLLCILECPKGCSSCTSTTESDCTSCEPGYLSWEGQCLKECSEGTYPDSTNSTCLPCSLGCKVCPSESNCLICLSPYYKSGSSCVQECPPKTYHNDLLRECSACDSSCKYCYGPTSHHCLSCNEEDNYINFGSTYCQLMECPEGTYLSNSNTCLSCDPSCLECNGEGEYNCTSCIEGLTLLTLSSDAKQICSSCPTGFKMDNNGMCIGILFVN